MRRPGVRTEVERIEREETEPLDALPKARQEAGLEQAEVAARMGTQARSVARLERTLATGKHSRDLAQVRQSLRQAADLERSVARLSQVRPDDPWACSPVADTRT